MQLPVLRTRLSQQAPECLLEICAEPICRAGFCFISNASTEHNTCVVAASTLVQVQTSTATNTFLLNTVQWHNCCSALGSGRVEWIKHKCALASSKSAVPWQGFWRQQLATSCQSNVSLARPDISYLSDCNFLVAMAVAII